MEDTKFKVTVSCMTYNHAKYITDAMNGFVMQQTSFPFVCTIVDDASTDGEPEVIRKYVEENFDFSADSVAFHKETDYAHITYAQHKKNKNCYFAVLYLKENHYSQRKDKSPYLKEWRDGVEYMAICEGDDYWISPDKLEKQVDYLDLHPDCALVWAKAKCFYDQINKYSGYIGSKTESFMDLLYNNGVTTLTTMIRTSALLGYNDEIKEEKWLMGDKPLWLYISIKNKIHFENKVYAVYRILHQSASMRHSYEARKNFVLSSNEVSHFFAEKNAPEELKKLEEKKYIELFCIAYEYKNFPEIKIYFKRVKNRSIKMMIKYFLCLFEAKR